MNIRMARDNAPPTKEFGTISWVMAFNDHNHYPKFAQQVQEFKVRCASARCFRASELAHISLVH
jgi:hypothetical protein